MRFEPVLLFSGQHMLHDIRHMQHRMRGTDDHDDRAYDHDRANHNHDYVAFVHVSHAFTLIRRAWIHCDGHDAVQHLQDMRLSRMLWQQLRRLSRPDRQRDFHSAFSGKVVRLLRVPGCRLCIYNGCSSGDHYDDYDHNYYQASHHYNDSPDHDHHCSGLLLCRLRQHD